jgi:hypothetical protein
MKFWYDKEFKGIICEPNSADEWLEYLWAIGCDYDGCNSAEDLKKLIDELVKMAQNARKCLLEGKIFEDEDASADSLMEAQAERKRCADA